MGGGGRPGGKSQLVGARAKKIKSRKAYGKIVVGLRCAKKKRCAFFTTLCRRNCCNLRRCAELAN